MSVIPSGFGSSGGYQIQNSLRFDGSNDYLTRTPAGAGNQTTWTLSFWLKRSRLGVLADMFYAGLTSAGSGVAYYTGLLFNSNDTISFYWGNSSTPAGSSTAVFRDVSAWYHFVVTVGSGNVTVRVNNVSVLSASISGSGAINSAVATFLGAGTIARYNDCYLSEINFIDGQALTAGDFGYTDAVTGQWRPKKYTGTYGTNGFYLPFNDGSSTTTLGLDNSTPNAGRSEDKIPTMTSNTAPSGTASASTEYPSYGAHKAFDKVTNDYGWTSNPFGTVTGWLAYEFTSARTITQYSIYNFTSATASRLPKSWTFEGWNGSTWVVLHTVTNESGWAEGQRRYYTVTSSGSYAKYRINVSANQGSTEYVAIDGLEMFETGNGINHWTLTNMTRSAGVTDCWMTDTPTNNYATLNPLKNIAIAVAAGVVDEAALRYRTSASANAFSYTQATFAASSGKWYYEAIIETTTTNASGYGDIGWSLASSGSSVSTTNVNVIGNTTIAGRTYKNNAINQSGLAAFVVNDVVGIALDLDNLTCQFYLNGAAYGTQITGLTAGEYSPYITSLATAAGAFGRFFVNFGQRSFQYTPPTGYKALCAANLPVPSILNPRAHFDIKTYTGNASTQNITGLNFTPDMVWMKSRGRAVDHALFDSVRGVQKMLESNQTGQETTETTGLTAFNSDGWTMGALDQINGTTATNSFVGWAWKANGAAVTNTSGTITSQVSANTTAGFSIVTYTSTRSTSGVDTIGHGLGVAPKLVISKSKNVAGVDSGSWFVHHGSTATDNYLRLNTTAAVASVSGGGGGTMVAPTSSVFSAPYISGASITGNNYVAYCFAEVPGFSRIGSYTGNGSTDGPFVWCGFRPRYVMWKRTDTTGAWIIVDTSRDTYNPSIYKLAANTPTFENDGAGIGNASDSNIDVLANGFKHRTTSVYSNANGGTYIFAAFAEYPFNFANAR